jgi:hypothetical protein
MGRALNLKAASISESEGITRVRVRCMHFNSKGAMSVTFLAGTLGTPVKDTVTNIMKRKEIMRKREEKNQEKREMKVTE